MCGQAKLQAKSYGEELRGKSLITYSVHVLQKFVLVTHRLSLVKLNNYYKIKLLIVFLVLIEKDMF